jgi:ketopantoate reductase
MLADRRAGRPMEIDARNGVIVRYGREHGIPTPMNALMVAMLEAAEDCRHALQPPAAAIPRARRSSC